MKKLIVVFLFTISCVFPVINTNATVLLEKDFQDLAIEADIVFIGTVSDIYSEWKGEQYKSKIHTYVTFSELEIISGNYKENTIVVRLAGGEIDDVRVQYSGVPEFRLGNRNLLFLSGNYKALCPISGWSQGIFHLVYDYDTGEESLLSYEGKLVQEIRNNEIILNKHISPVTGSPGIPDATVPMKSQKVLYKTGKQKKITLGSFVDAIRKQRSEHKRKGGRLGYKPPISKKNQPDTPNILVNINNH
ncbi:hypothetical protein KAJ27_04540 [bacterium]|nr:hypothetical protein [bacterium]